MTKEEKLKKATEAKEKLNKDIGKGTVMSLSEKGDTDVEVISTRSLGLDIALGVGGLPKGRIVEIYGPESSGKTTVAIHAIAEAQSKGGLCAIIDAEHAFDAKYASQLGVKVDELDICQPDSGDEGLEVADRLIDSGAYDLVVIDSVAALVPKAELEGEMGESKMGLHARLMSQALRKMVGKIEKTNTCVIFINQLRDKIGVMFGNPETTTGGNALKFYASVRLDVRRSITAENSIKEDGITMGNLTRVHDIKNKVAPPFRKCEFNIRFGEGIDKIDEIVNIGKDLEIFKKWGDTVTFGDTKYSLGDFKQMLKDNEEFRTDIETRIKDKVVKK